MSGVSVLKTAESTGLVAGRYRIESVLGRGGAGEVCAVSDAVDGRKLALKRLLPQAGARAAALFEREYRTLASLRHPRIVEVYEFGRDAGGSFYTMELLEGADLSAVAPLPWREVCACLRDAASILGLLHARRLLHRDLSPRNVWRQPDGRLKLIDFGALAPFGAAGEIVGTPPFVPPEALQGQPLDQRADLYALGALGYWLLTSVHAFPAKSLAELTRFWQHEPAAPSSLVALMSERGLPPIPGELDDLILALLRPNPHARPLNTSQLIDRLCALAGLAPEADESSAQAYLHSKAFVGRARERERVAELLRKARAGEGQALLVEALSGMGRTRLLDELAVLARLEGALTVAANKNLGNVAFGVVTGLASRLLSTLPEQARAAAEPHKRVLAHLSAELREQLGVSQDQLAPIAHGEQRIRLQLALRDWLLALSREVFITIIIDDYDAVDEESQALLASLAMAGKSSRLLLVATIKRDKDTALAPGVHSFRQAGTRFRLLALTAAETAELCESLFGQVPYLSRLSERLFRVAQGAPAHTVELAEQLVKSGVITYADGMWSLPTELPLTAVPVGLHSKTVALVDSLDGPELALAELLSIARGALSLASCSELGELPDATCQTLLDSLLRSGVLIGSGQDYRIADDELRALLNKRLDASRAQHAHLRLGRQLSTATNQTPLEQLRAGVHLLHGGALAAGLSLINRASYVYAQGDVGQLRSCTPPIEEAVLLLRKASVPVRQYLYPLSMLAVAGYFVERSYGVRYGDDAVAALQQTLRLDRAQKLGFLGKKLALIVTLLVAGISLRVRDAAGLRLADVVRLLITVCSALSGVACICFDPRAAARHAKAIEPLAALGENHVAHFIHAFSTGMSEQVQDRPSLPAVRMRALIARLETGRPIREMRDYLHRHYLAGAYFARGVNEGWRLGQETLQIADRLEQFGPMYAMSADYLRASYYACRGQLARADEYQQRVEMHAVQLGTAWQVETWSPIDASKRALQLNDAILMKRATQELERLSVEIPSLVVEVARARGAYLVLRGRHDEALALLDNNEEPLAVLGWTRARGILARALNGLGQHHRALAVCQDAQAQLSAEDLAFFGLNLAIQIETALAHAGLSQFEEAKRLLRSLLETLDADQNPLLLGALHEASARVALLEGDFAACEVSLRELERWYRPTAIATLTEQVEAMTRRLDRARQPALGAAAPSSLMEGDVHLMTRVQLMLTQTGDKLAERANKGLQIALELTGADDGFIVVQAANEQVVAHAGQRAPEQELVQWAGERLRLASARDETALLDEVESLIDLNLKQLGELRYCVAPLWARHGQQDVVVAAIALGFARGAPRLPNAAVLGVIAGNLMPTVHTSLQSSLAPSMNSDEFSELG